MGDLRDLKFIRQERMEDTRPQVEHAVIANTPADHNDPVFVTLPEFADDQTWGPYRWVHNGKDKPQEGDDCLVAFSNRREGWILCYWSEVYTPGDAVPVSSVFGRTGDVVAVAGDYAVGQVTGAAPLASPAFTGSPTAPTPLTADNSTAVATTAFVKNQGYLTSVPVTSVFGRTGAIVATTGDYSVAQVTGAAPLANPAFTGTPTAPTPAAADNSTTVATTAFVKAQGYVTAGSSPVTSVFGRAGAVTATTGDYTAAQVTNAADKASASIQAFTAPVSAANYIVSTGATAGGAFLQGGNTYNAGNNWMTGMVAGNIYFDGTNWQNKTYGGNNGWYLIGFGGANSPGEINFYGDAATGGSDRSYTPAQVQALRTHRFLSDGSVMVTGRIFSGVASTGGIWVDGGSSQFVGSNSATVMGFYNAGWWLLLNNAGDLRLQGTYGLTTGAGVGGSATAAATSLTLNKISGAVTFTGQSNTASVPKSFVVTNSTVGANDVVMVSLNNGTTAAGSFVCSAIVTSGSFTITALSNTANTGVTYSFNFWVMKSTIT